MYQMHKNIADYEEELKFQMTQQEELVKDVMTLINVAKINGLRKYKKLE